MGKIITVEQPYDFDRIVATKGADYHPDFRVLTAGIESVNDRTVHMIGSSTVKDLQGDTMSLDALNSMTKAAPNLTIWLNHDYTLPDSMFGSILGTPAIKHADGIADLHLNVDVELSNQAAAKVKRYIDNGRRLGCSIGCMVTKYEIPEDENDVDTWSQPIIIHDVYVVEYSVVGIPANQRSWVENAIRGVFQRTLDPSLAPAMKSLWPSKFHETLKSAQSQLSTKHFNALTEAPVRSGNPGRVHWHTDTKSFALTWNGKTKQLASDELASILTGQKSYAEVPIIDADIKDLEEIETEVEEKGLEPDMDKVFAVNKDGSQGIEIKDAKGNHAKYTGMHTHHHDSFGHGDVDAHSHEHFHSGDNQHSHDHSHTAMGEHGDRYYEAEPEKVTSTDNVSDVKAAEVDAAITELADEEHPLVEKEAVPEVVKDVKPEVEKAAELAPVQATKIADAMLPVLASYNMLGKGLGLPEVTPDMLERAQHPVTVKALDPVMLQQCQSMHDALTSMTGGAVCANSQSLNEIETQATEAAGSDVSGQMNVLNSFGTHISNLTKAFEGLDIVSLKKDATDTQIGIREARKQLDALNTEIAKATTTLAQIKNMPLGNPVQQSRTVHAEEGTVTREELLKAGDTEETTDIFARTELKSVQLANNMSMTYRHWPVGVGKGLRPPLTSNQIQFMDYDDVKSYREGGEANVPHIDNQVK